MYQSIAPQTHLFTERVLWTPFPDTHRADWELLLSVESVGHTQSVISFVSVYSGEKFPEVATNQLMLTCRFTLTKEERNGVIIIGKLSTTKGLKEQYRASRGNVIVLCCQVWGGREEGTAEDTEKVQAERNCRSPAITAVYDSLHLLFRIIMYHQAQQRQSEQLAKRRVFRFSPADPEKLMFVSVLPQSCQNLCFLKRDRGVLCFHRCQVH